MKKLKFFWFVRVVALAGIFSGCAAVSDDIENGNAIKIVPKVRPKPPTGSIQVSPDIVALGKGSIQRFTAEITGGGSPIWSVSDVNGNAPVPSGISDEGILTVAGDEKAGALIVTASHNGASGGAVVWIIGNETLPESNGIGVNPQSVALSPGESRVFTATEEEGTAPLGDVTWSVAGRADYTGFNGTLTVSPDETADTLTVKASVEDGRYGTALVTALVSDGKPVPVNNGISVTPQTVSVERGLSRVFKAYNGSVEITSGLSWEVFGAGVPGTSITKNGALTVVAGETAKYLTVKAKTTAGYGTAVVKVTDISVPENTAFNSLAADGEPGAVATATLTLNFSDDITGLLETDIAINANGTGLIKGTLTKMEGETGTYTLGVSGITAGDRITVTVSKDGYTFTPTSKQVDVHSVATLVEARKNSPSIKEKFGIKATEKTGVTAAFNALSAYIKTTDFANPAINVIKPGDYIDLEGGLNVAAYNGRGNFTINADQAKKTINGKAWLRLIVVGINSFQNKNGNGATPHVVFQFLNVPANRRMNSTDNNMGGYAASEMREYLTPVYRKDGSGNFLTGLKDAGVPENVLWSPKRVMSTAYNESTTTTIEDKLWLPTEWEMFGKNTESNSSAETLSNQETFTFYEGGKSTRVKYNGNGSAALYWLASVFYKYDPFFCNVYTDGDSGCTYKKNGASSEDFGVVPAFCVR